MIEANEDISLKVDEEVAPPPANDANFADAMKGRTMRINLPDEF